MPEMDGFSFAHKLLEVDHKLKICFLTGFHSMEDAFKREFPKLGRDHLLQKPVSIKELKTAIQNLSVEEMAESAGFE